MYESDRYARANYNYDIGYFWNIFLATMKKNWLYISTRPTGDWCSGKTFHYYSPDGNL